jgi:hypothetical protein
MENIQNVYVRVKKDCKEDSKLLDEIISGGYPHVLGEWIEEEWKLYPEKGHKEEFKKEMEYLKNTGYFDLDYNYYIDDSEENKRWE